MYLQSTALHTTGIGQEKQAIGFQPHAACVLQYVQGFVMFAQYAALMSALHGTAQHQAMMSHI